ncbi:uncharacterized protein LOC18442383 isoform X1 [Amborella trichopoda]|uniref:uncharacterized protein LOC18442383 isoform X1 n=1 Tax=Amborella trichopoda TaxID=13333 RepID=UPI0005D368BA|nr:uncharacterized protein LOC18442383 isoform X1 [Amborella trichopoda]|eukprot:XP_011626319.1 uncharacterized protein LOC18442383 isoform X1 [Amborella trichopoda]
MPRGSRHKSHKENKHSERERVDSEEEGNSKHGPAEEDESRVRVLELVDVEDSKKETSKVELKRKSEKRDGHHCVSDMARKGGSQSGKRREMEREMESNEWQLHDELRNPELEKELDKRISRRRDGSGDKDKWKDDVRDGDDRHHADRVKNGRYEDERPKEERHKEKYREDIDRDHRHRDEKYREDRSSRDRIVDRSDYKYSREETRSSESRQKKNKPYDSDQDGSPYVDERSNRSRETHSRKRLPDDNEDHSNIKYRGGKDPRVDEDMKALSNSKLDNLSDKERSGSRYRISDAVDVMASNSRRGTSPTISSDATRPQLRHSSKQSEPVRKDSTPDEKFRQTIKESPGPNQNLRPVPSPASEGTSRSQSKDKVKQKQDDYLGESPNTKNAATSSYKPIETSVRSPKRSPKTHGRDASDQLIDKSPSPATHDRHFPSKTRGRRSLELEETESKQMGSRDTAHSGDYLTNEDRIQESPMHKSGLNDGFKDGSLNGESRPGSSVGHFSGSSSSLLPPPPPFRQGIDSPSLLGPPDDEPRAKPVGRYKRGVDPGVMRGQGNNPYRGVQPNWNPPLSNAFISFPHHVGGPGTFHPMMQQFASPPLFGIRPPMELSHGAMPYTMHDGDRFSIHSRPFGWRGPSDDSCSPLPQNHMHGWDCAGAFGDDAHMYMRPEWDNRAWETGVDMWKGQSGNVNLEVPPVQKESEHQGRGRNERTWSECLPAESIEIKRSKESPNVKAVVESPSKTVTQKSLEPRKPPGTKISYYLSKLDISVDLAGADTYKECASLLSAEKDVPAGSPKKLENSPSSDSLKENMETVAAHPACFIPKVSFFPKITDAIFKKAMELYKEQIKDSVVRCPTFSLAVESLRASPASEGADKPGAVEGCTQTGGTSPCKNGGCNDSSCPQNQPSSDSVEIDRSVDFCCNASSGVKDSRNVTAEYTASENESFPSSSAQEKNQEQVFEALRPESERTQESIFEALGPESIGCSVNLSRIHHSPENTH